MNEKKLEQVRFHSRFEIVKDSIERINPEFSLCTVLVAYHGDNRNRSSISKEVFEKSLWSIFGIPLVGEWLRREGDPGDEGTWGSHGGRIIIDDEGIRYEQTTKPFGFVTEEAYKNATWVEVLEKDGHTKNEYLKLENCILWNSRYEECDSILEKNYGQSMELSNLEGYYREGDGYFVITNFTFSALCILGTAEPCFESAMIGRQYEMSQLKKEFQLMMESYKKFNLDETLEQTGGGSEELQETQENSIKEEDNELENVLFSRVCANIGVLIAENTFRQTTGKQYSKYIVLSINEEGKYIVAVDREDRYAAYKIPYIATETKGDLVVSVNYENRSAMALGAVEQTESIFNIAEEIEVVSRDASDYAVSLHSTAAINELASSNESLKAELEAKNERIAELERHLDVYEAEKQQFVVKKHKDIIDALIASRREEMGNYSEFLEYCIEIDYNKTIEEIEQELKDIHYNFMMKNRSGSKASYSTIEFSVATTHDSEYAKIAQKYGEDVANMLKKIN